MTHNKRVQIAQHTFVHVPTPAHDHKLKREDIKWENINRICFRGDARDPQELFVSGFKPNKDRFNDSDSDDEEFEKDDPDCVIIEPFATNSVAGFIPVSTRFTTATFFPMDPDAETTWVYTVKIKNGVNVHGHSFTSTTPLGRSDADKMFVQEIITDQIPAEDIIAAVNVKRSPRADYPYDDLFSETYIEFCGCYEILNYKINPNCKLPEVEKKLAIDFIEKEMLVNKTEKFIPSPSSGYMKNNLFKPQKNAVENCDEKEMLSSLNVIPKG